MDLLEKAKDYVVENIPAIPTPEATLEAFHLKDVSTQAIDYTADVAFKNPYSQPIPICEILYTLKSNGREIASGNVPDPGSLKAKDTTVIYVGVKVPHNVMVLLIKDIGADWDIDYQLDVNFIIDVPVFGNITVPVTKKGEIKLPTLSDLF